MGNPTDLEITKSRHAMAEWKRRQAQREQSLTTTITVPMSGAERAEIMAAAKSEGVDATRFMLVAALQLARERRMIGLALMLSAVDGDTLRVDGARWRLFGIDAPEMSEAGGEEARQALQALIAGQTLACYIVDTDRYGRAVVICYLPDGRDVSCVMVGLGHAEDWPRYSGGRYGGC